MNQPKVVKSEINDITEWKKMEEQLDGVNKCFLDFGTHPDENIEKIVQTAGLVLGGACALYNKEEGPLLCTRGGWNVPEDFKREDSKESHICYDVITKHKDKPFVINNLDKTPYAKTDPNVTKYKLKAYIGCAVKVHGKPIASLCVVYQEDKVFSSNEVKLLSILARALGVEEERKEVEESLRASENKYRTLLENLPQKIFLKDRNSVYVSCNENYARDLRIKPEEIAERTDCEFYPKELAEKYRRDDKRLMDSGKIEDIEEKYIQDGKEVIVHTVKTPLKDEQGNVIGILGIFWDITERKRAREKERQLLAVQAAAQAEKKRAAELARAYEELKETKGKLIRSEKLAALGKLASMVGHELRTPLGVIKNSTYFLRMKLSETVEDEKVKEHLNILDAEVNTSDRIITDILIYGRIKEPELARTNINHVVKECLSAVGVPENIEVATELNSELPEILADRAQLRQVFSNIISNAVQSMPEGGRLDIRSIGKDEFIEVDIADTGQGIPKENLNKIFEAFFSTTGTGTGLGLTVCQSMIEGHGGSIEVESEVGKGTKFMVKLPVTRKEEGDGEKDSCADRR